MSEQICLVSANDLIREGLSAILSLEGFEVLTSVGDIDSLPASDIVGKSIVVLDATVPGYSHELIDDLLERLPSCNVVILVDTFEQDVTLDCFKAGARGLIVKSFSSKPLVSALRLISLGERVFPSQLLESIDWRRMESRQPSRIGDDISDAHLSPRELDVLCCLMAGYPNKTIARQLDVCEATVKVHVKAILRKLNVRNRTQAAIWASSRNVSEMIAAPAA